jgi:transcriptional antiterminator NusG
MVSMVLLKKINEEKRKLEVMVKIFGRKTPLEIRVYAG